MQEGKEIVRKWAQANDFTMFNNMWSRKFPFGYMTMSIMKGETLVFSCAFAMPFDETAICNKMFSLSDLSNSHDPTTRLDCILRDMCYAYIDKVLWNE